MTASLRTSSETQDLSPPTQKQQRRLGLILGRRGHLAFNGEVSQKRLDLGCAHVLRVALVVEQDEATRPVDISAFGANGIVTDPDFTAKPVEQARGLGLGRQAGRSL